jgi:prepilin-type processing-associated H-X9-DG protein
MLPYLEEIALSEAYDYKKSWFRQDASLASTVIPTFTCPSNGDKPNPLLDNFVLFAANTIGSPLGGTLGLTDYVFSKGVSDAFCNAPESTPDSQRGMFDYNLATRLATILDGTSNTIAMGEAASGPQWPLCTEIGCQEPDIDPLPEFSTEPYYARQSWIGSGNVRTILRTFHWAAAGQLACTIEPLNKSPVTHFLFDDTNRAGDCQGTLSNPANSHRVSNFRSDHPGGGSFLFADGSVHFVTDGIAMPVYRALSTVAGADAASPE